MSKDTYIGNGNYAERGLLVNREGEEMRVEKRAKGFIESSAVTNTITFPKTMYAFVLIPDGFGDITMTIKTEQGDEIFKIKDKEIFDENLEPFKEIVVDNPMGIPYRAYGRE